MYYIIGGGPVALPFGGIGDGGGGGGGGETQQPRQQQQPCSSIANLAGANTDVGLLSRLIFAEATGSEVFNREYRKGSGMSMEQAYLRERYAIAATVYNRVAFLSLPGPTLGVGMRNSGVADVIGSRGASGRQYEGFQYNNRTGQIDINRRIQDRVNQALNSPVGSNECNDLLAAIYVANEFVAGRGLDPFGTGMSFGFRTTDSGSPGSAFPLLGTFPGSRNTFYGPPKR